MTSVAIRDELMNMKIKLESLEEELTKQLVEAETKYKKWNEIDKEVEEMRQNYTDIITLNVGGKIFQTRLDTLLSVKDTLFYKIIVSKRLDLMDPIFIDRNYKLFKYILSFLRYQKVNLKKLSSIDLDDLMEEAKFFEIEGLIQFLEDNRMEVKYVGFQINGAYTVGGTFAGTNNIDDLNNFEDRSALKGICATYPGSIILELNREIEIEMIEVAGWGGNRNIWAPTNGSGASILTSIDNNKWTKVGSLPNTFNSNIITVNLGKSNAKYIKFDHNSYLGLGYCRILKL
jgi:hypothetical protein